MSHTDDAAEVPELPELPKDTGWRRLFVVILVAVAGLTVVAFTVGRDRVDTSRVVFSEAFRDDFERSDGTRLSTAGWSEFRGAWAVAAGAASVTAEGTAPQLALRGSVSFGAVEAWVSGSARCGIVVRYFEPGTYVVLERVPAYAVWNLVSVRKGKETVLGKLDEAPGERVKVRLETGQRVISAVVGDHSITVTEPAGRSSGFVGLFARADGAASCAWDDFVGSNGR